MRRRQRSAPPAEARQLRQLCQSCCSGEQAPLRQAGQVTPGRCAAFCNNSFISVFSTASLKIPITQLAILAGLVTPPAKTVPGSPPARSGDFLVIGSDRIESASSHYNSAALRPV